jgi:sugar lactone lactonase YvrE
MEFDPQGRLLVAAKGAILRFDKAGAKEVFATSPDFKDLQDITVGSNGSMYVTNYKGKTFFQVSADGKTIKPYAGLASPTGIEWIEEKNILYVSDLDPHTTWQYAVAADGSVATKTSYVPDIPGAFGITMDVKGQVYIAGYAQGSIHLYSTPKKDPFLGHILIKGSPNPNGNNTNQAFGGPDNKILYVTGNGGAFKIPLLVAGRKRPAAPIAIRPLQPASSPLHFGSNRGMGRDVSGRKSYPTAASIFIDSEGRIAIPLQIRP